ncbi:MAG: acetolactate synthase large subunit [Desulfobacteraceae bacterium]|nr:MAG: acetolactate synthase large subunit [Desulfobacteraceae bacterium]
MKASDLMIRCLEAEGIEYVFGVPGEENADFLLSLDQSQKIRFILCRHEQGAAFMAEVYGRLTGNPAVCLSTLGPGATNLITGVADANMDRAPMLAITGQGDSHRRHKESHQIMDVVSMYRPVTKFAQTVLHPDTIPEIIRKAVRLARTEKPGACLIELPEDIAKLEAGTRPIEPRRFRRPVPDDKIVDKAWRVIAEARRPIILAGNGTIRKRASKQLRRFVEQTGIGVVGTFMGKGAVDMNDERCCFTIGLQDRDFTAVAVDRSDVVITLGYDMVEYPPRLWNSACCRQIVHIDFIPAEIDANYPIAAEIVGDLAHTLWMLNERAAAAKPMRSRFDHSHTRKAREEMLGDLRQHAEDNAVGQIKPQKVIWDTRAVLGPQDILLSDVGAHKMWVGRYYHCNEPNTCLIPNGFCAMGFALPGAIGAALVHPERKVMAVCGDAALLMNVQEMETARRLNSNIVVQVWQDNAYGLIAWKQQHLYGRHTDLSFGNPDFVQMAHSFGWHAHHCERSADLQGVLRRALDEQGPSLVVIPIDYRENLKLTQRLGKIEMRV